MNEMCRRGHEVTLVVREPEARFDQTPFYELHPAIRVRNLCRWAPKGRCKPAAGIGRLLSRLWGSLQKRWRVTSLRTVLEDLKPDIVAVFLISHFSFVHRAMGDLDVPIVLCHRNDPAAKMAELSAKGSRRLEGLDAAHRRAALVSVQLEAYRSSLPPEIQVKTVVIPNACITAPAAVSPLRENLILSVGRLAPAKNHRLLVEAFATIASDHPDWNVEIYGDGPEADALKALIAAKGLSGRVHLKGTVADIDQAYRRAGIFAFPSLYEGFARALSEAMAHGLPSVCLQRCTFCREMIETSGGGLLTGDDVRSYAAALQSMMAAPDLRNAAGISARSHVASFTPKTIFDRWEAAFDHARQRGVTLD